VLISISLAPAGSGWKSKAIIALSVCCSGHGLAASASAWKAGSAITSCAAPITDCIASHCAWLANTG
jgi:hypothetical protein